MEKATKIAVGILIVLGVLLGVVVSVGGVTTNGGEHQEIITEEPVEMK